MFSYVNWAQHLGQNDILVRPTSEDYESSKQMVADAKSDDADELRRALITQATQSGQCDSRDAKLYRLLLRPMIGHDNDPDIAQRLEAVVATIVTATNRHTKLLKHGGSFSAFAIIFGPLVFQRSMISWLAHHASKNHWSLIEDDAGIESRVFTASTSDSTERICESDGVEKKNDFGSVRVGEEFIYADKRYRKLDNRRAEVIVPLQTDNDNAFNFYPEDEVQRDH
ncbi:hypothetical protein [Novipirellula caenicola]|uniref:Uncharacterized protein n=1 Tax=Novipirellula caenicola TaxID=1536901 RepID=A0ABP9W0Q2_9BACT